MFLYYDIRDFYFCYFIATYFTFKFISISVINVKICLFSCDQIFFFKNFKTVWYENKTTGVNNCYSNLLFRSISCAERIFLYSNIAQINSLIRTLERINYERSKTINCKLHYCSIYPTNIL